MEVPRDITAPLPLAKEGDPAWILSAEMVNFINRKVNAFTNIQAVYPLRIVKSDAGMKLVLVE